jgi:hypothetical protein
MHNCPHCRQELSTFAFYCPRCRGKIGELRTDADMLAIWWLNAQGDTAKKWAVKTLKSGSDYLNLLSVSPACPSAASRQTTITFMAGQRLGDKETFERRAVDVFAEVSRSEMQEWQIQ